MKKILLVYLIIAFASIMIVMGFLTTTKFAMVMEYKDYQQTYKETLIEDASLKEYSDSSKDLRDYFDEYVDSFKSITSNTDGSNLSFISTAFAIGRIISILIAIDLFCAVVLTIFIFVVFILSLILPQDSKIYQKLIGPVENGPALFSGFFGIYAGALFSAVLAVHIPQLFMNLTLGEKINVSVVYTEGANYLWGALIIGILTLVGKFIANRFAKSRKK